MGRPRGDIQPRILRAARARFVAEGVDGASLRAIAKDARTSIGMVFYYFPTKDALFLAVVEDVYAKLVADLDGILSSQGSVRERLGRAFVRLGQASEDELDVVRLFVREALVSSERFRAVLRRFRTGHVAVVLRAVAEGVARGEIDDALPLPMIVVATFGIGGLSQVVRRVAGADAPLELPSAARVAELALAILFDGIGARGGRARAPAAAPAHSRGKKRGVTRRRGPAG